MSPSTSKDLILYSEISTFQTSDFLSTHFELLKHSLNFGKQTSVTQKFVPYHRLLGRALLLHALQLLNIKDFNLKHMTYSEMGKPQLETNPLINFNISHSEQIVVCAVSLNNVVGIDIEKEKTIDIYNFKDHFSDHEWDLLNCSSNTSLFFDLWTKKEALLKALGHGLSIPLKDIEVSSNRLHCNNDIWTFSKLHLMPNYCVHFTCNNDVPSFEIKKMTF